MENKWYRFNNTEKTKTYQRKGIDVITPDQDKIYFNDETIDAFSLETVHSVPHTQDFVSISNYFIDYWGYILGMDAAYTWIRYVRHVYRVGFEQHKTITDMAELLGISRNSLKKYISILESYGFLAVFYKDVKDELGKPKKIVNIKVRKTTPFLTPDLVKLLPLKLQNFHELDILKYERTSSVQCDDIRSIDEVFGLNLSTPGQNLTTEISIKDDLSTHGQNLTTGIQSKVIHNSSKFDQGFGQNLSIKENTSQEVLYPNINTHDLWEKMLSKLHTEVSQRILTQFFTTVKTGVDLGVLKLSSSNFIITWIEEKYGDLIKRIAQEIEPNILAIKYLTIENE